MASVFNFNNKDNMALVFRKCIGFNCVVMFMVNMSYRLKTSKSKSIGTLTINAVALDFDPASTPLDYETSNKYEPNIQLDSVVIP
jgi:hypothetical protein